MSSTEHYISILASTFLALLLSIVGKVRISLQGKQRIKGSLFYSFENFFMPTLAQGFSPESYRQLVSSRLQDSSQYCGLSQKCRSWDGLHLSSYFQVLQSLYQTFVDCNELINYSWYDRHFDVPYFFSSLTWCM